MNARHLLRGLALGLGALVSIAFGLAFLHYSFGGALLRSSYDLPFLWRSTLATQEVVIVYLDEESAKQLHQPLDDVWNRELHTKLLERLQRDGAKAVFYDIVFDSASVDPASDAGFAAAIKSHGKVVLGAAMEIVDQMGGAKVSQERIIPPIRPLRKAAMAWGLLVFRPIDSDYAVRQMYLGTSDIATSTWKLAEALGGKGTHEARESATRRWLNYYGPRDSFSSVNFAQALYPDGVAPGYFKDKVVFIGGRSAVGYLGLGKDEFATPYSRFSRQYSPGLEVHATIFLNLLRGDWLTRLSSKWEMAVILAAGVLAGTGLTLLRPVYAFFGAVVLMTGITCAAFDLVWHHHIWFNWLVPAGVQVPLGFVWSVGSQYLIESRRRKALRQAFGFYLSPEMADRISESDFDLKPGGKVVEVTVIFTDLENFTTLSENLDPTEASQILIAYFEQTTRCVLDRKGTIIKYIGDAVFAAWGAPVAEPAHAIRAAEAACDLRSLLQLNVRGRELRTRVGIHSGPVLAGNLGSSFRFDYTMIGDAVNFASRLESLNKYLGTQVIMSDAVRQQLGDQFVTRALGEFRVAGKTRSVIIYELVCQRSAQNGEQTWIDVFEEALTVFRAADFDETTRLMKRTQELREGTDGPAQFYLRKLEALRTKPREADWAGIVELTDK